MTKDLEKEIKTLERKLKLSKEALEQAAIIRKKYDEAQIELKELNASLDQKVNERTKRLQEHKKYLQSIIDGVDNPIMVIKNDYTIEIMNNNLLKDIDTSIVQDINQPKCYEISHRRTTPCDGEEHPCPLRQVMQSHRYTTLVHKHYDANNNNKYVELAASPLFDEKKNCIGIIESARDITEYLEVQDELREQKDILDFQAHHDSLTNLPNRLLFDDRLKQAIESGKRNKNSFALFFIDLDRFKQINDSLGHKIGDEVLKEVASRIGAVIRAEDTLSRLGGDEFTILMHNIKKPSDASQLAQKILASLSNPLLINEHVLYISSSIGISLFPQDGDEPQNLVKFADAAMYKAKEEGRNNFQFYSAHMTQIASEHIALVSNLRQALENEEFQVYYQPQIDSSTNTLTGMEALVRWLHPTMGLIMPGNFIPLAEETGIILEIDKWVMKTAIEQAVQWRNEGLDPGVIAINLSARQLEQKDFVPMLRNLLKTTKCKAQWIALEVTESHVMSHPERAIKILNEISDMGIELAIDDFGTGYSSLSYLKKLPIDKLKIDQSFIKDLPNSDDDSSIVKAIIALGQSLNMKILAEGVELQEQNNFLLDNHCNNIQGFLHSKPITAADIKKLFLLKH